MEKYDADNPRVVKLTPPAIEHFAKVAKVG